MKDVLTPYQIIRHDVPNYDSQNGFCGPGTAAVEYPLAVDLFDCVDIKAKNYPLNFVLRKTTPQWDWLPIYDINILSRRVRDLWAEKGVDGNWHDVELSRRDKEGIDTPLIDHGYSLFNPVGTSVITKVPSNSENTDMFPVAYRYEIDETAADFGKPFVVEETWLRYWFFRRDIVDEMKRLKFRGFRYH